MADHKRNARPAPGAPRSTADEPNDTREGTSRRARNLGIVHDALTLTSWDWPVFPCRPGAKLPATRNGFHDATVDVDTIIDWFDHTPNANIGIATGAPSGVVVIDVDPGGDETIRGLIVEHGPLPRTLVARTPRGGFHGYYAHPGGRVPCSAGRLGPGVDVRGDGGYVVAPPSSVDGIGYVWRDDPWPGPPELPNLPPSWLALLTDPPAADRRPALPPPHHGVDARLAGWVRSALTGELEAVATATSGTRNHRLNAASFRIGQLVAAGAVDHDQALVALEAAAVACGLPAGEARRTIASGTAAGQQQPAELPEVAA